GPAVARRRGHPRRLTPNPEAVRAPYTRDEQRPDQRKDGPMRTWHPSTLVVAGLTLVLAATSPRAASHREAPLMTLDPAADITDVYAFVSYDTANLARASADRKVTLILNVIPAQEPSSGPNYFAIDLGAVFDTVNLRRTPLPVETAAEDANDAVNPFGVNAFSGFNVNTIAIEVPAKRLTGDGAAPSAANGTIGVYASTSRQQVT